MNRHALNRTQDFSTRLFLPTWWVRAFSYVTVRKNSHADALQQVWETGICPMLDDTELNALAMVLSSLQAQILSGESNHLRVAPSEYQKHASSVNKNRLFTFSKILQSLPGLRFLLENGDEYIPVGLFEDERWAKSSNGQKGYELEFKPSDLGKDLILGYSNSHLELIRRSKRQITVEALLGDQAPLSLWRSVWQEMSVSEQAFLLRLEKAMQWECAYLHFDGIFGKNLFELIYDLDIKAPVGRLGDAHNTSQLPRIRTFLERIGKKLCQHGLLKFDVDEEYLALSAKEEGGAMLLWQASSQRMQSGENDSYRNQCMRYLVMDCITPRIDELIDVLFAGHRETAAAKPELIQAWMDIISTDFDPLYAVAFDIKPSMPVLALPLFFEWMIRQVPGHRFPLCAELVESELGQLTQPEWTEGLNERFRKFSYLLSENSEYRKGCIQDQMSTLSLSRSLSSNDFRRFLATYNLQKGAASSSDTIRLDAPLPVADKQNSILGDSVTPKQVTVQSAALRKLASDELTKIQSNDPAAYKRLKDSYLNSLDASRKRLLLDLQNRIQAEQFEAHLKHSLIRFMVDHPSLWKSVKAPVVQNRREFVLPTKRSATL